jgi:hypothetical protein
MLFAKVSGNIVIEFPIMEPDLRKKMQKVSLPQHITQEHLEGTPFVVIEAWSTFEKPRETLTHALALDTPVLTENGWERTWKLVEVPAKKLEARTKFKLREIRARRDVLLSRADGILSRYFREERLGLPHVFELSAIDAYMQALADVTKQEDLFNVEWPTLS